MQSCWILVPKAIPVMLLFAWTWILCRCNTSCNNICRIIEEFIITRLWKVSQEVCIRNDFIAKSASREWWKAHQGIAFVLYSRRRPIGNPQRDLSNARPVSEKSILQYDSIYSGNKVIAFQGRARVCMRRHPCWRNGYYLGPSNHGHGGDTHGILPSSFHQQNGKCLESLDQTSPGAPDTTDTTDECL